NSSTWTSTQARRRSSRQTRCSNGSPHRQPATPARRPHERMLWQRKVDDRVNTNQTPQLPPDRGPWEHPELRLALAARDITRPFRLPQKLAALQGIPQPEVPEITHAPTSDVRERIVRCLGIPPRYAGPAFTGCTATPMDSGKTGLAARAARWGVLRCGR